MSTINGMWRVENSKWTVTTFGHQQTRRCQRDAQVMPHHTYIWIDPSRSTHVPFLFCFACVGAVQSGNGITARGTWWSTKLRALSKWIITCGAWPTAACHRSVTRTTTVPLTRRASSTPTTLLHSKPTRPTLSPTAPAAGAAPSSLQVV